MKRWTVAIVGSAGTETWSHGHDHDGDDPGGYDGDDSGYHDGDDPGDYDCDGDYGDDDGWDDLLRIIMIITIEFIIDY